MIDELHKDYVRTARSKGLTEGTVRWRHAFKNAIGPVLIQVGHLGNGLDGPAVHEHRRDLK